MTLFSTLNQPKILWLFSYLGFVSGIIFFTIFKTCIYLKNVKFRTKILFILQKSTSKKQKKNKEKNILKKQKIKNFFFKIFQFFIRFFAIIFSVFALFFVLTSSYLLNLRFNYGEVTFVNIAIYCVAFMIAKMFINLLAKFLQSFYNRTRLRRRKLDET
jgi:hypothetical protein